MEVIFNKIIKTQRAMIILLILLTIVVMLENIRLNRLLDRKSYISGKSAIERDVCQGDFMVVYTEDVKTDYGTIKSGTAILISKADNLKQIGNNRYIVEDKRK